MRLPISTAYFVPREWKHAYHDSELYTKNRGSIALKTICKLSHLWNVLRLSADDHPPHTQTALLDQWTQFLITDSLIPENQISTDDFAGALANQTNLAIKGIVGIGAMAEIASLLGDTATSANYSVRSPVSESGVTD